MSYTAPQYVDTKEQAILALASTIKGEAVTGGDGSVNRALDILADVLAEQDVQVPQTDAGAILALADYVSGGGGGGGDFTAATVTMQRAEGFTDSIEIQCACVAAEEGLPASTNSSVYSEDASCEFTAILYKGKCLAHPMDYGATVTVAGDVTYDSSLLTYIITGDCTFTFSNA